jgi:hypothetical protein
VVLELFLRVQERSGFVWKIGEAKVLLVKVKRGTV